LGAQEYVENLWMEFVVDGKSETHFDPDAKVTRAEFLKMVMKTLNVEEKTETKKMKFKDLEAGAWYETWVEQALAAGLVTGYEDGTFKPNASINRAEAVTLLLRAAGIQSSTVNVPNYPDVDPEAWYAPYLIYATEEGIVAGYEDGTFGPNNALLRGEAAKILSTQL
jgi:hypothetical protein